MTQEQKDLLLKDLCSRIPYGVKVQIDLQSDIYPPMICKVCNIEFAEMGGSFIGVEVLPDSYCEYREFLCKPYLFPLSSMTEEQKKEYTHIVNYISSDDTDNWKEGEFIYVEQLNKLMHFYHKNHLDFRDLIEKGLAIDATNKNIY